jgi:hypothetical protein
MPLRMPGVTIMRHAARDELLHKSAPDDVTDPRDSAKDGRDVCHVGAVETAGVAMSAVDRSAGSAPAGGDLGEARLPRSSAPRPAPRAYPNLVTDVLRGAASDWLCSSASLAAGLGGTMFRRFAEGPPICTRGQARISSRAIACAQCSAGMDSALRRWRASAPAPPRT